MLLSVAASALGQVGITQSGQVLDSNYQIGGGGINRRSFNRSYRTDSQLYVTGQVTGLGSFRGNVGYVGADQLRLDLPSAGFSTFRRQSVGLSNVIAGGSYHSTAYYDRSTTVLDANRIAAGQNVPGTNVPRSDATAQAAQKLYASALQRYRPLVESSRGRAISASPASPMIDPSRIVGYEWQSGTFAPRAGSDALFGIAGTRNRLELARELYQAQVAEGRLDGMPDKRIDGRLDLSVSGKPEMPDGQTSDARKDEPGELPPARHTAEGLLPAANQDVFVDMLVQLRRKKTSPAEKPKADNGKIIELPAEDTVDKPAPPRVDSTDATLTDEVESGSLVNMQNDTVIVRSLAGRGNDLFNLTMRRAQHDLRAGKFYTAAGRYEQAMSLDPGNPLARIGYCLALFSAGESFSAARSLHAAMSTFPPMMETHVRLSEMLDAKTLSSRLGELDKRLSAPDGKNNVLLRMLAVFVTENSNRYRQAEAHAKVLKKIAGSDKLLAAYASYIITGFRPGVKPAPKK